MYGIIAIISLFVRQFLLPNPFEPLGDVFIRGLVLSPTALNWLAGLLLVPISYITTGFYYRSRENPAWGSFLFLFFYCVYVGLLQLMSLAHFAWWAVVLILVGYIGLHIAFNCLRDTLLEGW